jgi:hypothetical protein
VASSRSVEQTPLVRLQVGAGRSRNAKCRFPHRLEEMLVKVSLSDYQNDERNEREEGSILKIVPLFSFVFFPFRGRLELCIYLEWEFKEFKCAIRNDTACLKSFKFNPSKVSFADGGRPVGVRFSKLSKFCGGIATVIPGTSTVEFQFSVTNSE